MTNISTHQISAHDEQEMAALREIVLPHRGEVTGIAFREPFIHIMESVLPAPEVSGTRGVVGGIPGWWCLPSVVETETSIMYLHGGAYIAGSAEAHRHLAGHIAHRTGAATFLPDYRLAPEHPFPAALDDAWSAWQGLIGANKRVALVGDSAGGGLALSLLQKMSHLDNMIGTRPCAVAVMSPWTDLALTGESLHTLADVDILITAQVLQIAAAMYTKAEDSRNPLLSPLYGDLSSLPPLRIDVGADEILLDDTLRYAARAEAQGSTLEVAVWSGMPHVFPSNIGRLQAAGQALDAIARFLRAHFA